MRLLLSYALAFVGRPYIWGGDDPIVGFDCSGFVQELLASVGADPAGDQTAQTLYEATKGRTHREPCVMGDLLFFGKDLQNIVHVAMALDNVRMIEAGGGGSKCTTVCAAAQQNAYIRVRPIARRPDLVAICRPNYPATQ